MAWAFGGSRFVARESGETGRSGHVCATAGSVHAPDAPSARAASSRRGGRGVPHRQRLAASIGLVLSLLAQPGAGLGDIAVGLTRSVAAPIARAVLSRSESLAPAVARGAAIAAPATAGLLALATEAQAQSATVTRTIIPFRSPGWKYLDVAYGGGAGFEQTTFDDSSWSTGTAAFGDIGNCPLNNSSQVHTAWPELTDMLLRKHFYLPAGAAGFTVLVPIDDDVQVWLNGTDISNGMQNSTLCAQVPPNVGFPGYYQFTASDSLLRAGPNVLALRARDVDGGGNLDFVDVQVTATIPTRPVASGLSLQEILDHAFASEPANTLTGNFTYGHTDIAIPGRGASPTFTRAYNSLDTRTGPLGPGWTHSYFVRLDAPGDPNAPNDLVLVQPDGRSDRYTFNSSTQTFTTPTGVFTTLSMNADGGFTALHPDQSSWTFDSVGDVIAVTDRYGNTSTLTYGSNGQVASLSDPAGRGSLTFAYDTCFSGRLCSVTDWSNRVVAFTYDASGRLATVLDRQNDASHRTTYGYDGTSQRLTTITDPNGHVALTNTYDPTTGKVSSQKDALNHLTNFGQYGVAATCPAGASGPCTSTTVTYPASSFDSKQMTAVDTYDSLGRVVQRTNTPSNVGGETFSQSFGYDTNWNRNSVTDADNNTTNFCFDANGNLTRRVGPSAFDAKQGISYRPVTFFQYDTANNLTLTVPPEGMGSLANAADCTADLSATANGSAFRTTIQYDNSLKPQTVSVTRRFTDPDAPGSQQTPVTTYTYDVSTSGGNPGRLLKVTSPRVNPTVFTYNTSGTQAGMLASVTGPPVPENAGGNKTSYTYDSVGRRLTMVDPIGNAGGPGDHTWTYQYDNEDRPTRVQAPQPSGFAAKLTTVMSYDPVGNRLSVQDPNGQFTRYLYDVRDSLQEVDQSATAADPSSDPNKIVTLYTYDNLGNLQRVKRASGSGDERATDYLYDGLNRLRKEIQYPSWPATTPTLLSQYTYDGNGNRTRLIDPLNQTTDFGYDVLNRLTGITYTTPAPGTSATANVTYSYDANNNRISMADGTGSTSYVYDELDRPTSVTTPGGPKTVGYRYDLDGNRKKVIYPDNTAVGYTFDAADRLQSLADWANRTTSYSYFQDSRVNIVTNVNGTTATYGYDEARRLLSVQNKQSNGNTIDSHTYQLDQVGNRKQLDETLAVPGFGGLAQTRTTYGYDNLYRLKSADTAPLLSAVVPVALAPTSVAITWETAAPSTSQVQYGTTLALGSATALDSALVTTHRQTVTGLTAGTTYFFAVVSQDAAGNSATSATFTVTTLPTSLLGDQAIEQSRDSNPAGTAQAFPFTASSTGSINRLFWYLDVTNAASTIAVGLYNDGGGHPNTLQTAGLITTPANGTWNAVSVPAVNLTSGTQYWLAILTPFGSGTVQFRDVAGSGSSETSSLANLAALPTLWVTGQTWTTGSASAFVANVSNASLDLQPPTLQVTSQTNGQTVSGTNVTVTVSASDAVGVSYVQLLVDDVPLGAPVIGSPYSVTWDTTLLPNGGHSLSAWAQDAAGNVGYANKVYVIVSNTGTNPVAVPLAGDQSKELQSTTQVAGQANAFQYTATASGTATQLQVFLDDGTMASQVQVGLYSDSGGHPGTLLTQGTVNTPVNWAWNAVPVPPVSVTANTKYWIAVLSPNGTGKLKLLYQGTGSGGTNETSLSTTLTALPSSWSTGATSSQQLMSAYIVQQPQDGGVKTDYTYDKVGNRLTRARLGITTSYTYDKADHITQAGLWSMSVNPAGNETVRGQDGFVYDQANRLTGASPAGGLSTTSVYDGDGRRMKKTVGTNPQINYSYDISSGLPMLLDDGGRKYVFGVDLAYETAESGTLEAVYHSDGLRSERTLTDAAANVIQSYRYDEFGIPVVSAGVSLQPFGYTGEQRDQEPRLQYLRARMYDPSVGRFIQQDLVRKSGPGVGGWNAYTYVGNNPVCLRDPSGLTQSGQNPEGIVAGIECHIEYRTVFRPLPWPPHFEQISTWTCSETGQVQADPCDDVTPIGGVIPAPHRSPYSAYLLWGAQSEQHNIESISGTVTWSGALTSGSRAVQTRPFTAPTSRYQGAFTIDQAIGEITETVDLSVVLEGVSQVCKVFAEITRTPL